MSEAEPFLLDKLDCLRHQNFADVLARSINSVSSVQSQLTIHGLTRLHFRIRRNKHYTNEHMENLSLHDAGPQPPPGMSPGPAPVPQLPPQMFTTAAQLLDLTDKKLMISLRDGRKLIGVLRSWDQFGRRNRKITNSAHAEARIQAT